MSETKEKTTPTALDLAKMESVLADWKLKLVQQQEMGAKLVQAIHNGINRNLSLELIGNQDGGVTLVAGFRRASERVHVDADDLLPLIVKALQDGAANSAKQFDHVEQCLSDWKAGKIAPYQDAPGLWTVVPE